MKNYKFAHILGAFVIGGILTFTISLVPKGGQAFLQVSSTQQQHGFSALHMQNLSKAYQKVDTLDRSLESLEDRIDHLIELTSAHQIEKQKSIRKLSQAVVSRDLF